MLNSGVLLPNLIWMPNNTETIWKKVGEMLRRPALHAIILHCGTTSTRVAPPDTLTDSFTRFLEEAQPYLNSMTRTPKSKLFVIALPKYTLSQYIGG